MTAYTPIRNQRGGSIIGGLISFIFGIIITLVALRFVFRLFGANASNGIVSWIYDVSEPFVRPFFGIFNADIDVTTGNFELGTLIALIVYALIAGLLTRLFAPRTAA